MKKIFLVALILLCYGLATTAQLANNGLLQNETVVSEIPVSKISLNSNDFSFKKNALQLIPDPEIVHDKAYYLKKSRDNRIASICLAGGGLIIGGIGALSFPKDYDIIFENSSEKESQADFSIALVVIGSAALLTSIPFTVMSSVYKRKARLMVTSQKTGFGVPQNVDKNIMGVTMSFPIGK